MPDGTLKGLNSCEAVEEIAHEIRTRQLSILSLVQLIRRIESKELEVGSTSDIPGKPENLDSIQVCVHEISELLDKLIDYVREEDSV